MGNQTILQVFLVAALLANVYSQTFTASYSNQSDLVYTSTDSINKVNISTVNPAISTLFSAQTQSSGALGYNGPLGPLGPLGTLGPVGSNSWNTSILISTFNWSSFASILTVNGGPLSKLGPLGSTGPLNPDIYQGVKEPGLSLFSSSPFARHLRGLGLWSALGSIGPLGALGPLGPLGTIGSHGYKVDTNGNFKDNSNKVVRQVTVDYDGTNKRTYDLFENYSDSFALSNPAVLDTSFMIMGALSTYGSSTNAIFTFTSAQNQIVTIVLVPEKSLDSFSLGLYDQQGKLIGTSEASLMIQTIQIKAVAGQSFTAMVQLNSSLHFLSKTYRLIVVGSTQYLNMNNVSGNHILPNYQCITCSSNFPKTIKPKKLL